MRKVLIGTPCHDGKPEARYTASLAATARACLQAGIDQREVLLCYDSLIQSVRNELVATAINNGFDDLVWIDADQDWHPADFLKLLRYPVDCVGAAIRKKSDIEQYNVGSTTLNIPIDPKTGLLMPDKGLGTGFLRMSRRALLALWDVAEPYTVNGKQERWIFDVRPINGELTGEDMTVTRRLISMGIPVHLDPKILCGHTGVKRFDGDFGAYLKRLQTHGK